MTPKQNKPDQYDTFPDIPPRKLTNYDAENTEMTPKQDPVDEILLLLVGRIAEKHGYIVDDFEIEQRKIAKAKLNRLLVEARIDEVEIAASYNYSTDQRGRIGRIGFKEYKEDRLKELRSKL